METVCSCHRQEIKIWYNSTKVLAVSSWYILLVSDLASTYLVNYLISKFDQIETRIQAVPRRVTTVFLCHFRDRNTAIIRGAPLHELGMNMVKSRLMWVSYGTVTCVRFRKECIPGLINFRTLAAWHGNLISGISRAKVLECQGPRRLDAKAKDQATKSQEPGYQGSGQVTESLLV